MICLSARKQSGTPPWSYRTFRSRIRKKGGLIGILVDGTPANLPARPKNFHSELEPDTVKGESGSSMITAIHDAVPRRCWKRQLDIHSLPLSELHRPIQVSLLMCSRGGGKKGWSLVQGDGRWTELHPIRCSCSLCVAHTPGKAHGISRESSVTSVGLVMMVVLRTIVMMDARPIQ